MPPSSSLDFYYLRCTKFILEYLVGCDGAMERAGVTPLSTGLPVEGGPPAPMDQSLAKRPRPPSEVERVQVGATPVAPHHGPWSRPHHSQQLCWRAGPPMGGLSIINAVSSVNWIQPKLKKRIDINDIKPIYTLEQDQDDELELVPSAELLRTATRLGVAHSIENPGKGK